MASHGFNIFSLKLQPTIAVIVMQCLNEWIRFALQVEYRDAPNKQPSRVLKKQCLGKYSLVCDSCYCSLGMSWVGAALFLACSRFDYASIGLTLLHEAAQNACSILLHLAACCISTAP